MAQDNTFEGSVINSVPEINPEKTSDESVYPTDTAVEEPTTTENENKSSESKEIDGENVKKVVNNTKLLDKVENPRKLTLMSVLLAPLRLIEFLIRKAIALLDKFTGYDKLEIKSPETLAVENDKKARFKEEIVEDAREAGAKDQELVQTGEAFKEFLNKTYGLDGFEFNIIPMRYEKQEPVLMVESIKDGVKYIDAIGLAANCCMQTNALNPSKCDITHKLNAAWLDFAKNRSKKDVVRDNADVFIDRIKKLAFNAQNHQNPLVAKTRDAMIINGVCLYMSAVSVGRNEPEITIRPYLQAQKNHKGITFPSLNESYTFKLSDIMSRSNDFKALMNSIYNASKKEYSKNFNVYMQEIADKLVANGINEKIKEFAQTNDKMSNLNELVYVTPVGVNTNEKDKSFIICLHINDATINVKLDYNGNVIMNPNDKNNVGENEKTLIESVSKKVLLEFTQQKAIIKSDNLSKKHNAAEVTANELCDRIDKAYNHFVSQKGDKEHEPVVIKIGDLNLSISKALEWVKNDKQGLMSVKISRDGSDEFIKLNSKKNKDAIILNRFGDNFESVTNKLANTINVLHHEAEMEKIKTADIDIKNAIHNIVVERELSKLDVKAEKDESWERIENEERQIVSQEEQTQEQTPQDQEQPLPKDFEENR